MIFDLRTMYAMTAVACVVLGLIQYVAYRTGRFERWLAWWAASSLLIGVANGLIVFRDIAPDFLSIQIGNLMTIAGCLLLPAAVHVFAGGKVSLYQWVIATTVLNLPLFLLWREAGASPARLAYVSAILGGLELWVAWRFAVLARKERLSSAKLACGVFIITGLLYWMRVGLLMVGVIGQPALFAGNDPVHSWIGLVGIVFVSLRSMVILLMAAERSGNQLRDAAYRDPLTGALNRGGLAQAFDRVAGPLSLLLVDVDHFKQLNDAHGHAMGDEILRRLVATARNELDDRDLLGRHGGDEFVIIMPGRPLNEAKVLAERIRAAFAETLDPLDLSVRPTLSIGAVSETAGMARLETLLHRADQALYVRKRNGRNGVDVYSESLAA